MTADRQSVPALGAGSPMTGGTGSLGVATAALMLALDRELRTPAGSSTTA